MSDQEKKVFWFQRLPLKNEKFRKAALVGAITAVFLMAALIFYWNTHVSTDDAFIEAHIIPISPKVPGHALKVGVEDNQQVQADQLLVEQDARDYQVRLAMAKADWEAAEAEKLQASEDAERYQLLHANDELSKQQLDRALLRLKNAKAQVDKARASKDQAELQLSYTKIISPSEGRVTKKSVEVGAYLQTGQALMAIVPSERWVVANFKETQLTRMKPGQKARIHVDAYPGKKYKAHIESIQRGTGAKFSLLPAENATGNFVKVVQRVPVKIVLDEAPDSKHALVPGMSVVVNVSTF